jgi:hypothetical protein
LSYLLYLQSDIKRSISNGEERFNQLSLEERGKFDEETLVNVNNLRRRMMAAPKADRFNNEYIVVRKCFHINHNSGNKLCGFFLCRCFYIRQLEVDVKASF